MASRVTQVARRTLTYPDDANARVTQLARRTLTQGDGNARVTQVARRTLVTNWTTPGQSAQVDFIE